MSIYSRYKYDRAMDDNFRSRVRSHYVRSLWARGSLLAVFLIVRLAATHTRSEQTISAASKPPAIADFIDIASPAGLSASNVFGGEESSTYILESTGTGAAIFDLAHASPPGKYPTCLWKGIAVFCGPRGLPGGRNILYRNLGNGHFQDMTLSAHFDRTMGHYCFSVSPFDFDNDGWPDIYMSCDSTPSILYRNNRDGTFTDVGIFSGVAYNVDGREQAGMGSTVADYDGDGNLDLFRTNFSDDTPTLYHNNGDGTFTDVTYPAGLASSIRYLGWGTMFFDFDNDGWPDLLLVNGHVYPEVEDLKLGIDYSEPKLLFHNKGDGKFTDISMTAWLGINTSAPARGLAIGDLWNDGRLSAVIVQRNRAPSLLGNRTARPNQS